MSSLPRRTLKTLPNGLTSIVNTRIFFHTLGNVGRKFDIKDFSIELSSFENGFAAISSVALPQVRFVKFPISMGGENMKRKLYAVELLKKL